MNFIVFPGQGSQKISMGKDLSDNFVEAREVFEEVNEALDFNLTEIMWGDDEKNFITNVQCSTCFNGLWSSFF